MEDSDDDDDDFEEDGEDDNGAAYNKMKSKLLKMKAGKGGDSDDSEEDANDADYEENAGEYALYDSPLESTDELVQIKVTLDTIYQADQTAYQYITSTIPEENRNAFIELLSKADELKQREAACKQAFEEDEAAKKVRAAQQ